MTIVKKVILYFFLYFVCFVVSPGALFAGVGDRSALENLYSDKDNWAWFALGGDDKKADLFIIAPTVYSGDSDSLNMPLDDEEARASFLGALNMEKGIYSSELRMFAPYYSQAGFAAYKDKDPATLKKSLDLAYEYVKAAFKYYINETEGKRPLVLAGFSQGGDMALRLLKEFYKDGRYSDKLIAAYVIGWRVTPEDYANCPYLKPASSELDTGVIISFNSEAPFISNSLIVPAKTVAVGINPLNWRTDSSYADKSLNKGACFTDYSGKIVAEKPNLTGAYLDPSRGTLKLKDISPDDYPPAISIFERGVYHVYDYLFFFRNLAENVTKRTKAYFDERNF